MRIFDWFQTSAAIDREATRKELEVLRKAMRDEMNALQKALILSREKGQDHAAD